MRSACLLVMLMCACLAGSARAGDLLIFSDPACTDSTLTDSSTRTVNLYVLHTNYVAYGASGVRFATVASPGFTGVWLGETTPFWKMGKSTTDIAVVYGECQYSPVLVMTISYQLYGTSEQCSSLKIGPAATFPVALCYEDPGCYWDWPCAGLGSLHINCGPVATESTTWGKVKALYRE